MHIMYKFLNMITLINISILIYYFYHINFILLVNSMIFKNFRIKLSNFLRFLFFLISNLLYIYCQLYHSQKKKIIIIIIIYLKFTI